MKARAAVLMVIATLGIFAAFTPHAATQDDATGELMAARALFQRNLDAIRGHDRKAYLECYWRSEHLARTGPGGSTTGYEAFERGVDDTWPEVFEATDLRLTPVKEGVVYGTYRYRVRFSGDESSGISERLFLRTPDGWRIAMTSAFAAPPGTPPTPRALVGGTLIDGSGRTPVRDALVILRDGKIEYAGPMRGHALPAGVDTVDVRGTWILPGLIDAHVHYSQTGWFDGRPDALDLREVHPYDETVRRLREHPETFHRAQLACGVTAVFDVGGFPWTIGLQQSTESDTRAPHVVAAGPLLTTSDHWLNLAGERQFIYLANDSTARACVQYLKSIGASAVKVWFIVTPARPFEELARLVKVVGEEARRVGLPLIVHATGLREANAALDAGARLLVHSVWDKPVDEAFLQHAKALGTIYCPTLTVIDGYATLYRAARARHAPEIFDPTGAVDSLTRAHIAETARYGSRVPASRASFDSLARVRGETMAANLKRVWRAGIPIAMGTDAGNPFTLHGPAVFTEMEAMQRAGMTPTSVIVAATRGGARAMGRDAEWGTIEKGKAADLLLVGADPTRDVINLRQVRWVVRGGVVRTAAELRRTP